MVSKSSGLASASVRALLVVLVTFALPLSAGAASSGSNSGSNKGKSVKSADLVDPAERKLDPQVRDRSRHKPNEESDVIVEFRDGRDYLDDVQRYGKPGRRLSGMNARVLRVNNGLLKRLAEDSKVKRITLDRDVAGSNGRTSATVGGFAVNYLMNLRGEGIGVAVIDSGITAWHDDLTVANRQGQRVVHFKDFVNGLPEKYDDWGHGTHVAGIIAGNGYDIYGMRPGIAPAANIIALKALNATGSGRISDIIAAIDYAISIKDIYNVRVINMSLGAGVYESYNTDPLTLAAKRAVDAGIVVVASAGNMGKAVNSAPQYGAITAPGNAPWVLTVGASSTEGTLDRRDDKIAGYSSRGPTMFDFAAKPDLVAPGSGTVSLSDPNSALYVNKSAYLVSGGSTISLPPGLKPYLTMSGTSMSAPVVSGTVALMLQANPNLTPNLVKAILQYTAQVYPGYNFMTQGAGFLNTRGAVVLAQYFATGHQGVAYPRMKGWSQHIFWGNYRVTGGVLAPGGTAWAANVVWGDMHTPSGANVIWGDNCDNAGTCDSDNIVWGNNLVWGNSTDDGVVWGITDADNIVWGNTDGDDNITWGDGETNNIVWGNSDAAAADNIVWGNDCEGANCDNIVWGNVGADNLVWGNAEGLENIVWSDTTTDVANIVWGNSSDDNISWGNAAEDEPVFYGDDEAAVTSFDVTTWDDLFEMAVPETTDPTPPPPTEEPPPPAEEPVTTIAVLLTVNTSLEGGVL